MCECHVGTNLRSRSGFLFFFTLLAAALGLEAGETGDQLAHKFKTDTLAETHTHATWLPFMSVPPRQKLLADLPSLLLSTSTNNFRSIQISAAPIYGSVCPYLTLARQQSKGWWAPQSGSNFTGELKKKKKESPWNHNYFFVAIQVLALGQEREGIKQIIPSVSGRAGSKVGWICGIGRGRCFCVSLLLISGDWKLPATVHRWAAR